MHQRYRHLIMLLWLLLLLPTQALAVSTVSINYKEGGTIVVDAADLEQVARVDLVITYNPALLSSPQADRGGLIGGAALTVDNDTSGMVHIVVTADDLLSGSGSLITLHFDCSGDATSNMITSFEGKLLAANDNPLECVWNVTNPPPPPSTPGRHAHRK